jgi:hypothetical protein
MRKNIAYKNIVRVRLPQKLRQRNKPLRRRRRSRDLRYLVLVRIAHDPSHSGQGCQLFGRALRVAASHNNFAIRIDALQSPDRCARIFICARRNRASIQHYNFRVAGRPGTVQSALQKLSLERSTVGLGCTTAKIFYVEARHPPILNEQASRLDDL